jgi:hypothetical protein
MTMIAFTQQLTTTDPTINEDAAWAGGEEQHTAKPKHAPQPGHAPAPGDVLDPPPAPGPCDELAPDADDELFILGERCAQAYMRADTLHYQAMTLLARFHHRQGWRDTGFASTAEWLAWRIGIRPGAARERLRTALALQHLPLTSEAMKNGQLSFTKVRALTRVATPHNEPTLLGFARAGSAANLERVVRGWKTLDRTSEVTAEQIRYRNRRFSAWVDADGMVVLQGRLDPEVGALLMRAVEAATDALYRRTSEEAEKEAGRVGPEPECCGDPNHTSDTTAPEQRRADALGLLAERALAAGFGPASDQDDAPVSPSRAERFQVMLHVEAPTLTEDQEPGISELEDGTRVSAETSRRIACDAATVTIAHDHHGQVRAAGRRRRTVPPALRRALEARDRGCRFPGCGLRFTDAHHVKHWADGGETSLRNLVLLCRRHHRAVHEGGVSVCIDTDGQVAFFTPRGKALLGAPPARLGPWQEVEPQKEGEAEPWQKIEPWQEVEPQKEGEAGPSAAGLDPRPETRSAAAERPPLIPFPAGAPEYKHDRDIPWEVEARAWEALEAT